MGKTTKYAHDEKSLSKELHVLVIDDNERYRNNLVNYLRDKEFHIAGSFFNDQAVKHLLVTPDLAVVGFKETAQLFYKSLRNLRARYNKIKIIVTIEMNSRMQEERIQEEGIDGMFIKNHQNFNEAAAAIESVMKNEAYYPPKRKRRKNKVNIDN